jgi:acid phosphatase type 7
VYEAASTNWSESSLTFATAPGSQGTSLSTADGFAGRVYVDFDVTPAVVGTGPIAFFVRMPACANDTTYTDFNSREAAAARPQLVITTAAPVLVAAGDIACDPNSPEFNGGLGTETLCAQGRTAKKVLAIDPTAVLTLGDNQYECGGYSAFQQSYDPSWGRFKAITHPAPGNHEYYSTAQRPSGTDCSAATDAAGYFRYFGSAAGGPAKGYYSFDLGSWHVIVLNSNCDFLAFGSATNGCLEGSPQNDWLEADLAATRQPCVLAAWHHARWSSGKHGNSGNGTPFIQDLYAARADLILTGHDHNYERFAPQNPSGAYDPNGVREFVVGTGGEELEPMGVLQPNSQVFKAGTFGVLKLTLRASGYDWKFVPEAGETFTDSGSAACH